MERKTQNAKRSISYKLKAFFFVLLAYSSLSFANPPTNPPNCVAALDLTASQGCRISVTNANNVTSYVDLKLFISASLPQPTTNQAVIEQLSKLTILVNGFAAGSVDIDDMSQIVANDANVETGVIRVDYIGNLSLLSSIQDLAAAFEESLYFIADLRGIDANKPVVVGYSLGAVITRYALTDMERRDINPNVELYVSYEGPHTGVYVPQSLQNIPRTMDFIRSVVNDLTTNPETNIIVKTAMIAFLAYYDINMNTINAQISGLLGISLESPIAKQLLMDNVYDTTGEYDAFMSELDTLGLPETTTKNLALTNGSLWGEALDDWELEGGNYYHFRGRIGPENIPNHKDQHTHIDFQLKPTVASEQNISSQAQLTIKYIVGFLNWTQNFGLTKDYATPANAKLYDKVPGGTLDVTAILQAVNYVFSTAKIDDQLIFSEVIENHVASKVEFTFVPTYSSLAAAHTHNYSAAVDLVEPPSLFDEVISMVPEFNRPEDCTNEEDEEGCEYVFNGSHAVPKYNTRLSDILSIYVNALTDREKVVLWLSDIENDEDIPCLACNDDRTFRDVIWCDKNYFDGCLTSQRRGGDADYYGEDLYLHTLDYGYQDIYSMWDAKSPGEATYTTNELVEAFVKHVAEKERNAPVYWPGMSKAMCEAQDIHQKHQAICDKLP